MSAIMPADAVKVMQQQMNRICVDSITIAPASRDGSGNVIRDTYGAVAHGTPVTYAALVVFRQEQIVNTAGAEQSARGTITLAFKTDGSGPVVSDDDLVTLPDGIERPRILAVERDPGSPALFPTMIYF